ncbi:hypothetical protein ACVWZ4_006746 [Bradyrhizobium sp. USDA 4472]
MLQTIKRKYLSSARDGLEIEAIEWFDDSAQCCRTAFTPLVIGFRVRGVDQARSRVRQAKMMKIATTTAPASIQY